MRPVSPVGVAGPVGVVGAALAALLLATGCTDRDTLRSASDPDASSSKPVPTSTPTHSVPRSAGLATPEPVLRGAMLTGADVAAEGVRPAVAGPALPAVEERLPGCLSGILRDAGPGTGKVAAAWRYPTGSVLAQLVAGYPAPVAERVLRGVADCGRTLDSPGAAVDQAAAARWCEPNGPAEVSCTALMTAGDRVSLVTVRARQGAKAAQAVDRLAPMAEEKLRRG
jgi:hypothetical protein